jgi:hypothetical protein
MNETPPKLADALATERTRMAADRTLNSGDTILNSCLLK